MSSVLARLYAIDLFGSAPRFNINGMKKSPTVCGVSATLSLSIFFGIILVFFMKDFVGRKSPAIITSDNKGGILLDTLKITNDSFPSAFGVVDVYSSKF